MRPHEQTEEIADREIQKANISRDAKRKKKLKLKSTLRKDTESTYCTRYAPLDNINS